MSEEAKRQPGPRGELGKGTPGRRLRSAWRKAGRPGGSLKQAVRLAAARGEVDAVAWLDAK